jgi:hypothetical protein
MFSLAGLSARFARPSRNTRHLEAAIEQVRREIEVPDDYLRYLSPLGWGHINLTGDYIWKLS